MSLADLEEFLNSEIKSRQPYFKGEWVTFNPETDVIEDFRGKEDTLAPSDLKELIEFTPKGDIFNTKEEADMRYDGIAGYDDEKDTIVPATEPLIRDELIDKITSMSSADGDMRKNRVWGPLNAGDGACSNGGLCRMLYCNCYRDTEEDVPDDAWFDGKCEWCKVRLEDFSHAVRIPMEDGGWYGCFCSFKCASKHEDVEYDEYRLSTAESIVSDFGIIDRTQYYN
jgi:hypothetical protein